jgi:Tfp pilus assembly protein PilZ
MSLPPYPILVVSYVNETRTALTTILAKFGVVPAPCATFCEAENLALKGFYSGLLVDLPSIIKSKGEEKIVAYTLVNFFPTLRVRTIGSLLVPMAMSGDAMQEKNLDDFLNKSCVSRAPKKLREFRRHQVCLSTIITHKCQEYRGFTLNVSWEGMFVVDLQAEKFSIGDTVSIMLPEFGCHIAATVNRVKTWGVQRQPPGVGLHFMSLNETTEAVIASVIKTRKEFDRDRLTP